MISPSYDEMQRAAQDRVNMMKAHADKYINMTNSKIDQNDNRQAPRRIEINARPVEMTAETPAKARTTDKENKNSDNMKAGFLQELLQNDRLIILVIIAALWNENSDRLLILALLYIML